MVMVCHHKLFSILMRLSASLSFFLIINTAVAQTDLVISGKVYTNSDNTWIGVDIERSVPTKLTFKDNSITSKNILGYMLQAGDEAVAPTNNNLDGAVITGNQLNWEGTDNESITHGIFTGHNRNVVIKYNYLSFVPMGIISKSSNNMSHSGGGVAYNIVKGGAVAVNVKGISNLNIFNNTFYCDRTRSQTWRALVLIYTNTDDGNYSVAHGTKIYNNIFYTRHNTYAITIEDDESLKGLECDYNVYWSDAGEPLFNISGIEKTFPEWQAMGFDAHSVVVNPQFTDLVNFVPANRLDYGMNLGAEWQKGLSANAKWGTTDPLTADQDGTWQAGAIVHSSATPSSQEIQLYPNPAKKYVYISNIHAGTTLPSLEIYDLSGRIVYQKILNMEFLQRVPVNLSAGIYFLKIETGSSDKQIKKLVVTR